MVCTCTAVLSGLYARAFETRFVRTWARRSGSHRPDTPGSALERARPCSERLHPELRITWRRGKDVPHRLTYGRGTVPVRNALNARVEDDKAPGAVENVEGVAPSPRAPRTGELGRGRR